MRISKKIKVVLIAFFLTFSFNPVAGQKIGYPYIINFFDPSSKILSADVNDFTFLPNGMIVAASSEGVLFYDGSSWSNVNIDGDFLSIAYDPHSRRIYLGTYTSFGYLEFDESFNMYLYKRLSVLVPDKVKNVWYIVPTKHGVYFFVNKHSLYLYDYKSVKRINFYGGFNPSRGFLVGGQLFVIDDSSGIGKVVGSKFIKLSDNNAYKPESIRVFLPTLQPKVFLLFTKEGGIYRYNMLTGDIIPLRSNAYPILRNAEVYTGCYLNDTLIALGTLNNGLVLLTNKGLLVDHLTVKYGLSSDQINRVKVGTNNKVIYLATGRFFNFVLYFYPFRFFDESTGFQGNIADYFIWRNHLFLATSKGLFVNNLDDSSHNFRILNDKALFYRKSLELMKLPDGKEFLIAGSLRELYLVDKNIKMTSLGHYYNLYSLKQSRRDPYRFYALSFDTLYMFKLYPRQRRIKKLLTIALPEIYADMEIDKNDNILGISLNSKRLDRLVINLEEKKLDAQIINSISLNNGLHVLGDSVFIVLTNEGLFKVDNQKKSLLSYDLQLNKIMKDVEDDYLDFLIEGNEVRLLSDKYLYVYKPGYKTLRRIPLVSKSWTPPTNLQRYGNYLIYNKSFELVFFNYQMLSSHGLYVDERPVLSSMQIGEYVFYDLINQPIFEHKDSIYTIKVQIPYSVPVSFKFSLLNSLPNEAQYSYYLKGYSKIWTSWTNSNTITYNSLLPLKYELQTRIKSNTTGKVYTLRILFKIKPPFLLSYYALIVYLLTLALLMYIAVKISIRRQEIIRRRLEKLVRKRTKELEIKNKVLEQNNKMLNRLTEELKANKEELVAQNEKLRLTNLELRQLSLVAQYTNNAVLILDNKGRIEWWNKGFANLFRHKFKKIHNAIIPKAIKNIRPDVFERLLNFDPNFKSVTYTTHEVVPDTGEDLWYQTTITAVRDDAGKIYRFVILDMDITDLKKAEKEIKQQRDKLEAQTQVLTKINQELLESRKSLEYQHQEMLSSLEYAKRLQRALLPDETFHKLFPQGFIFYVPKEIVSGDFYFFDKKEQRIVFAVGDATGHGVPGAFMSVLGLTLLKDSIDKNEQNLLPNKILETLRASVIKALHHNILSSDIKDGMDIGVGVIDIQTKKMFFAGANISLNIIRDQDMLIEIRGDRMPIGIKELQKIPFNLEIIQLVDLDNVYLYSDGFIDQFGGPENKRYKRTKFKNLLLELQQYEMKDQQKKLRDELDAWMLDNEQVDDILVIGFEVDFAYLFKVDLES